MFSICLLLLSLSGSVFADGHAESLAVSGGWPKLLHYSKTLTGYIGQADGAEFYLHPEGKFDPYKELTATLEAMSAPAGEPDKHAICRFPARFRFVKKNFPGRRWPSPECPDYKKYKRTNDFQNVSVVFSSYHLGSPASAFGHTFLLFGKGEGKSELLASGLSYAANTSTSNPLLYAVKGLSGGFEGTFAIAQFFYKVREYSDFEARDLYVYDLDFTKEETDFLTDHAWELGHTNFDYWYLTENCSYHVLSVLEAARPSLELEKDPLSVIPAETLKALMKEKNLVKRVRFRPSVMTSFKSAVNDLNADEKKSFRNLISNPNAWDSLETTPASKARILDTLAFYYDAKYPRDVLSEQGEPARIKNEWLKKRSEFGRLPPPAAPKDPKYFPHEAHGPKRLGLFVGRDGFKRDFASVSWRFALHDELDDARGSPDYSTLDFLSFKFTGFTKPARIKLQELHFVNAAFMPPSEEFFPRLAWRMTFGFQDFSFPWAKDALTPFATSAMGLSADWKAWHIRPYVLARFSLGFSKKFPRSSFLFEMGPLAGVLFPVSDRLHVRTEAGYFFYPFQHENLFEASVEARWAVKRSSAVGLRCAVKDSDVTSEAKLFLYF
jgi:hypothetical protein